VRLPCALEKCLSSLLLKWGCIMSLRHTRLYSVLTAAALIVGSPAVLANPGQANAVQTNPVPAATPAGGDIPAAFKVASEADDYVKRDVMIPMRDGVKLHTVIIIPKGAAHAPMILDRTPYSANKFTSSADSPRRALVLPLSYGELAEAGYIIVAQDVRGKYKSEADRNFKPSVRTKPAHHTHLV
jgi:uncharacterized protein